MVIHSLPDIVGGNAKVQISATNGLTARRLFLTATGGTARFGDVNVGAAQGVQLPMGVEVTISASDADVTDSIPLIQAYLYVPSSTTVTISYGV